MTEDKEHFRHVLLFFFRKGKNAAQTTKKICDVYGEDSVDISTTRKWFRNFKQKNFDLTDAPRSGRQVGTSDMELLALIESDRHLTTRMMGATLGIDHSTISRRLRKLGMVNKLDLWLPHELTEKNLKDRLNACETLLNRNNTDPFLKRLVTGDEKWILYDNFKRKRSWSKVGEPPSTSVKASLHPKKVMLCVWWDFKGIILYELLSEKETINSDKYCSQISELKQAIEQKQPALANRKGIVLQQDNARPHVSLATRNKLAELKFDVLVHPPYSPDLAPSDYHLFRSLQNSLGGKSFPSLEELKSHLDQFFSQKSQDFYERGIMQLPERWRKVIQQNGKYFTD